MSFVKDLPIEEKLGVLLVQKGVATSSVGGKYFDSDGNEITITEDERAEHYKELDYIEKKETIDANIDKIEKLFIRKAGDLKRVIASKDGKTPRRKNASAMQVQATMYNEYLTAVDKGIIKDENVLGEESQNRFKYMVVLNGMLIQVTDMMVDSVNKGTDDWEAIYNKLNVLKLSPEDLVNETKIKELAESFGLVYG